MAKKQLKFEERLQKLASTHPAGSRGFVALAQPDGLTIARPKRKPIKIPYRVILIFLGAFIGFKAFLYAGIGPQSYDDRLARLQSGTVVEKAGAFAMQVDPLTLYVANKFGPNLRKLF